MLESQVALLRRKEVRLTQDLKLSRIALRERDAEISRLGQMISKYDPSFSVSSPPSQSASISTQASGSQNKSNDKAIQSLKVPVLQGMANNSFFVINDFRSHGDNFCWRLSN